VKLRRRKSEKHERHLDGNCPIREHTGDGAYVGRCDFAVYDGECYRHGVVADYPNLDDRDVDVSERRWPGGRR
jgi:hypothetical protein